MKTFILIGGIGSGKSTVSNMMQARGAVSVDLDDIGHEVLLIPEVVERLKETFGDEVAPNGRIDRHALAAAGFANPSDTIRLNSITHPHILELAQQRLNELEAQGTRYAMVEISAYDGPEGTFAPLVRGACAVVAVTCPMRLRIERAVAKGFDAQDVKNRIARQVDDTQRALWADYLIRNKGTLEQLDAQVSVIWDELTS